MAVQPAEVGNIGCLGRWVAVLQDGDKVGSSFLLPPVASRFLEPVTLMVRLMNQ